MAPHLTKYKLNTAGLKYLRERLADVTGHDWISESEMYELNKQASDTLSKYNYGTAVLRMPSIKTLSREEEVISLDVIIHFSRDWSVT